MTTPPNLHESKFTDHIVRLGAFAEKPFSLVDVGASGGIASMWSIFNGDFQAIGFEPLIAEAERLNAESTTPRVRFENVFVSERSHDGPPPPNADTPIARQFSSALWKRASYLLIKSYSDHVREYFDPSGEGEMASRTVSLDDALAGKAADFFKVDTDGHDYPVLAGALKSLRQKPVLGLSVEAQFHGPADAKSNTFANIDSLLRREGFSLFDLETWCYSRGALPRRFVYPMPAQTNQGQIVWGEALYFRDLGYGDYERIWDIEFSTTCILKLACLFDMFRLQDCAAELLLKYRELLEPQIDVAVCLDLLTPTEPLGACDYASYLEEFKRSPEKFYPEPAG